MESKLIAASESKNKKRDRGRNRVWNRLGPSPPRTSRHLNGSGGSTSGTSGEAHISGKNKKPVVVDLASDSEIEEEEKYSPLTLRNQILHDYFKEESHENPHHQQCLGLPNL